MTEASRPKSFSAWLRRRARPVLNRPRLSFTALVFLVVLLLSPTQRYPARDLLLAFNVAAAAFIILIFRMMFRATLASMRQRAELQREGRWAVLGTSIVVSLATLVALSLELHSKSREAPLQVLLSVSTIVLVWVFVNMMFTLHYAHDFYDKRSLASSGLQFPGTEEPDYWDFMYFAFVLGMTFQVSDVQITSRPMRHFALLHGVLAFFFNVVLRHANFFVNFFRAIDAQCAASQFAPTPTSAFNGTASCATPAIFSGSPARTASSSSAGTSSTSSSCTCMISFECNPAPSSQPRTAIIASLIRSAAVPCMGALMAARSAPWRRAALLPPLAPLSSGRYRRRPNRVST